jgi:hypothetical protein
VPPSRNKPEDWRQGRRSLAGSECAVSAQGFRRRE